LSSNSPGERPDGDGKPRIDEKIVDRKLMALLVARHGAPRSRPISADEEERRLLLARRERAAAAADPDLMHHIERHQRSGERVSATERAALRLADQVLARRGRDPQPSSLRVREVGEVREAPSGALQADRSRYRLGDWAGAEVAEELREAMEHRTPQGFLRDLHRPVELFGAVQLRRVPSATAGAALARARAQVRAAMSARAHDMRATQHSSQLARQGMEELRAILARPWAESRPEHPLPLSSRSPGPEDMQWFGLSGGYDPDL
jgi:hypothetical protein